MWKSLSEILSGDGRESASARRGISVFSPDGSPVTSALDPSLVLTNIFFNSKMGEGPGAFSAADFTGDGIPEFFLCSARDNTGHFTVVDQLGETLLTVSSISANGFALLDVDYDGDYEALYGPTLYDWVDGAAVAVDTLPNPATTSFFVPHAAPVLADFTGDGIPEAVYITAPNTVPGNRYGRDICVYNFVTGEMLPGFPISLANPDATSQYWGMGQLGRWTATVPLVADLDGDGFWEIFAAAGSWYNREAQPFQAYLNIIDTPYAVPASTFSAATATVSMICISFCPPLSPTASRTARITASTTPIMTNIFFLPIVFIPLPLFPICCFLPVCRAPDDRASAF